MSVVHTAASESADHAERWRAWQAGNAATSRKDARRARLAFTIVFAALGAWLGLQLLGPALGL